MKESTLALRGILQIVGIQGIVDEIPDQYWPETPNYDDVRAPWLRITTARGSIVIGWRKKVIEINWKDSTIAVHGKDVVHENGITHSERMCHAWGYEQAIECLQRLWSQTMTEKQENKQVRLLREVITTYQKVYLKDHEVSVDADTKLAALMAGILHMFGFLMVWAKPGLDEEAHEEFLRFCLQTAESELVK